MKSPSEIQDAVCRRAEELARQHGYSGPGRFSLRFYKMALQEVSPQDRLAERGMAASPPTDGEHLVAECRGVGMSDSEITAKLDKLAETNPKLYKSYTFPTASLLATAREALHTKMQRLMRTFGVRATIARAVVLSQDAALREAAADLPDGGATAQVERERFAKLTSAHPSKVYATNQPSNPWHVVLPQLTRDELVRLVAKGVLTDSDITEWCVVNVMGGKKPIGLSPGLGGESQNWDDKLAAEVRKITDEAQLVKIREGGRSA